MADRLRIRRISVEGFKGFTGAQEIDVRARHVFLIGPNGNGKSSVIEAIRWALFGSTNRPNDIVRNGGYGGNCRVKIDLARDGKKWCLHRVLTPGGGGHSRSSLFDEDGIEHPIRNVLPQLDSLDAGEGTHIIFAAQSAPLHRQPEDLTPFARTVFGHLGLTHARAMLSHLETFVKEQEDEEASLDGLVSAARKRVDERIEELERRRGHILDSPPWDGERLPSIADTESKAKALIQKIGKSPGQDFREFSLVALVDEAERALEARIDLDRTPLDETLERLADKVSHLGTIREHCENIARKKAELSEARKNLHSVLNGASTDELREQVERQRQKAGTLGLRRRLGEIAAELLDRTEGNGFLPCPICGTQRERDDFVSAISAMVDVENEEDDSGLRAIETRWNNAQEFETQVRGLSDDIEQLENDLTVLVTPEEEVELTEAIRGGRVAEYIGAVEKQRVSVVKQVDGLENWFGGVRTQVSKLHEEANYHQLQRDLSNLRAIDADMKRVQRGFDQMVQFGESVRDIRDSVKRTLTKELGKKVPRVAEDLTSVFSALTRHPHFDRLVIDKQKLPDLELGVASSSDSLGTPHPIGVLNGQAQSALKLVPYFALSQAAEAPIEVYLVLLDDPTRAFDRDHIQILIERLADLGQRVQIVVATQEQEVFLDLLPNSFGRESYVVVEPKNWSYSGGPELVTEYD